MEHISHNFVVSPVTSFHGTVAGQEGKKRSEILMNGHPLEPDDLVSPTLTYMIWINAGPYRIRLDVVFVMDADDLVEKVCFFSPFFKATTERGYLEVIPTKNYWRLFRAA